MSVREKEILSVDDICTPLSVAKKEIQRRWNDKELRKKVEKFLGADMPKILKKEPKAVLSRYIATPNFEFSYFLDLAGMTGLKPVCLEYYNDKFVAKNSFKYHLCKLIFYCGKGKNGGVKLEREGIVNFNESEGKKLYKIKTLENENLVDFHHRILNASFPKNKIVINEFSKWFNKNRYKSKKHYYLYYLALFLCHGILFENFLINKEEEEFTRKRVLPSFKKIEKMFGIKPLIVPLEPLNAEADPCWYYYPKSLKKNLAIDPQKN